MKPDDCGTDLTNQFSDSCLTHVYEAGPAWTRAMVRNRTEELEQRLDQLEATVRGLTEELVEAHGRISELEDQLEAAGDDAEMADGNRNGDTAPTKRIAGDENDSSAGAATAAESSDGSDEEADLDDIIVA